MDKIIKIIDIISVIIIIVCVCFILALRDKDNTDYSYFVLAAARGRAVLHMQEKVADEVNAQAAFWAGRVWSEIVSIDDKEYHVSFIRISEPVNQEYAAVADYCLLVSDEDNNIIQRTTIEDYLYLEEVYWIEDINNDNAQDIILCTFYHEAIRTWNDTSSIEFLVWNKEKGIYELIYSPSSNYYSAEWNKELGTIEYMVPGQNDYIRNWEMYIMRNNEWELCAELLKEYEYNETPPVFENHLQEEAYYLMLDIIRREVMYENGEIVQEHVIDEESWQNDEAIIWGSYDEMLLLYPYKPDWEKIETEEGYLKYVRKQKEEQ